LRGVLATFALLATLICIVSQVSGRVEAQQQASASHAAAVSAAKSAPAAPIVIASGAQYANVRALATDAAGGLYISLSATPPAADCVTSTSAAPSGAAKIALTIFSNCKLAPSEDPWGIAVAPQSEIYLANRSHNTIRLLDMLTGQVSAIPARAGNSSTQTASSNLDPFEPAGLASDTVGNLYVADRGNNRVLGLAPNGAHFSYIAHVLDAEALAVDSTMGQLYVASPASNQVFVIDLDSDNVDVFAGNGGFANSDTAFGDGSATAQTNSAPENAALGAPEGVAVDGQGNVFISDTGANAIVRVGAKSGALSRVALAESLNSPGALAIDRAGDLFVADRGDQRVLEFPHLADPAQDPSVTLSPSTFNFGNEPTGGSTAAQQFTLTNNSTNAISLSYTSFTFTGADPLDFTQMNNCAPSLAAGASCQISVTFTPGGLGTRSATLEVTDSDPSSPQTASLSGTGDDFELCVPVITDSTQSVAQGFNANFTITVTPNPVQPQTCTASTSTAFSGLVALACPEILSARTTTITCSIQPATVNLAAGQTQTFIVTLTTAGPNSTRLFGPGWRDGPAGRMRLLLLCASVLMLALCFLWLWQTSRAQPFGGSVRRARAAAVLLALAAGMAAAGCGHGPPPNPNETPVGSYAVKITGTAQNAGRSITLTLNVT
jgi:sugar lactone lactonase YvrE